MTPYYVHTLFVMYYGFVMGMQGANLIRPFIPTRVNAVWLAVNVFVIIVQGMLVVMM